jgi:hypothetical protein
MSTERRAPRRRRLWLFLGVLALLVVLGGGLVFWFITSHSSTGSGWQDYKPANPINQAQVLTIGGRPEANPSDQSTWQSVNLELANPDGSNGEWQICFQHFSTVKCNSQKLSPTAVVQLKVGRDDLEVFGINAQGNELLLRKSASQPNYKL